MPDIAILLDAAPIDPLCSRPRILVGDRIEVYLKLADEPSLPSELRTAVVATVQRHGRDGGTAVLEAGGVPFAMDGDRYPIDGGPVQGTLTEIPAEERPPGLVAVEGVVRRIRTCGSAGERAQLRDTHEVPRDRDAQTAAAEPLGYVVEVTTDP